jgi:AraC-like DNA-binding protein
MGGMYHHCLPHPLLRPYIESYWWIQGGQSLSETIFVDAKADILFNFGVAYDRIRDGDTDTLNVSNLDGQRDHPLLIAQQGQINLVGVRFRAGGLAAFLSVPVNELSNLTVSVADIFGKAIYEVETRLYDRPSQVAVLDSFFLKRLNLTDSYQVAQHIANRIEQQRGSLSIQELSQDIGYSIRSVDRLFRQSYGVSPKFYARIVRFQYSIKQMTQQDDLARLAAVCGYYDQSHLNKDFQAFAGVSPLQFKTIMKEQQSTPNMLPYI